MLAELWKRFDTVMLHERKVMTLVAAGRLNQRIAAALDLSEITVKVYHAQVMRNTEAKSLPDVVG